MRIRTLEWKQNAITIIDQTQLPRRLVYLHIRDIKTLRQAIRALQVRGAPALGAAGALGVYLGIKDSHAKSFAQFLVELKKVVAYLASSRPTARNLFWGLEQMQRVAVCNQDKPISSIKRMLLSQAQGIIAEDCRSCRRIGAFGARLINNGDSILTVCNAGILATIDYGTALGVLYRAKEMGKRFKVFSCETRPLLQGARLTTWELTQRKIDVTLLCDNMAATLMKEGRITKVIVGADRIAANGDTANKIGTYNLAVLAKYHHIPFFVAAPLSTFDIGLGSGKDIPIEQRPAEEVTELFFRQRVAPQKIKVFNPAFDVTSHTLITAIITEEGIIRPVREREVRSFIKKHSPAAVLKPCV